MKGIIKIENMESMPTGEENPVNDTKTQLGMARLDQALNELTNKRNSTASVVVGASHSSAPLFSWNARKKKHRGLYANQGAAGAIGVNPRGIFYSFDSGSFERMVLSFNDLLGHGLRNTTKDGKKNPYRLKVKDFMNSREPIVSDVGPSLDNFADVQFYAAPWVEPQKPIEILETKAMVLKADEKAIFAETLIDPKTGFKQTRKYDRKALEGIIEGKEGEVFTIRIVTYPGERRYIYSKGNAGDAKLFANEDSIPDYHVDVKNDPFFEQLASPRNHGKDDL